MKIDLSLFKERREALFAALKKRWPLLAALVLGLVLLSLPHGESGRNARTEETAPTFSLKEEEEKLARALERLGDVGEVTVVLSLRCSMERELARDESSRVKTQEGSYEEQTESEAVLLQAGSGLQSPVTLRYVYPEYKGALVIVQRLSPTAKLEITNAVAALTGLATDKITVTTGN